MNTIEGSILIPILLFIFLIGSRAAISLYQEITEQDETATVAQIWSVGDFYNEKALLDVTGLDEDTEGED